MAKARLIDILDPSHHKVLTEILQKGGIVGTIWSHHLYFLACNAFDAKAVERLNRLKNRHISQVFASPGAVDEVVEFADLKKSVGLIATAKKMNMEPHKYLEFLYRKFPLAVELFANDKAPNSITFATDYGKTIWIAGNMGDKNYSKLLECVRLLRKNGEKIVFAGTSLNLKGENTLTVKEFEQVVEDFGDKIEAISVFPGAHKLKRLRYGTSCSVVSFTTKKPKLIRLGVTSIKTLKRYIPELVIPSQYRTTRIK